MRWFLRNAMGYEVEEDKTPPTPTSSRKAKQVSEQYSAMRGILKKKKSYECLARRLHGTNIFSAENSVGHTLSLMRIRAWPNVSRLSKFLEWCRVL